MAEERRTAKEEFEKAFLASAAETITDITLESNWSIISGQFMFSEIAEGTHRLYQSQRFQDPDYPERVYTFFLKSYDENHDRAIMMATHVLQGLVFSGLLIPDVIDKRYLIKRFLEDKGYEEDIKIFADPEIKYLDIKYFPDDFYYDLHKLINKCYSFGIYLCVSILSRKLLENIIIDILRKKYGMTEVDVFYDANNGRFHMFNTLIKNFSERLNDFKATMPSLDHEIITDLNRFREAGNSAAHTLEISVDKIILDRDKNKFEYLVKTLIRLRLNV